MVEVHVVLSMMDGRRMTSLGKNASGFGMDNLADGRPRVVPESLIVCGSGPRGEVPPGQEVPLSAMPARTMSVLTYAFISAQSKVLLCLDHKRASLPDRGIYSDITYHQMPDYSVRFSFHPLVSSGPLHLVFGEVVRLQKVQATVALGKSSRDHPMAGLSPPKSLGPSR